MQKPQLCGNDAANVRENTMPCPQCNFQISRMGGTWEAICKNCGFKLPCCSD